MVSSETSTPCTNPFFHRGPILDRSYFCNREQETARTLAFLNAGQSVALVGARSTGHTSLLVHVRDPHTLAAAGLDPQAFVFSYLDGAAFGLAAADDVLYSLAEQTSAALDGDGAAAPEGKTPGQALERLVRQIARRRLRLVFQLDNFAILAANRQLGFSFYADLASLATRFGVAYVVATREPLAALPNVNPEFLASAFYSFFGQEQVGLFTLEASRELLSGLTASVGCTLHPQAVEFLLSLAGPHPLLLQIAGYHAVAQGAANGAPIEAETAERVRAAFLGEAEPHWSYYWSTLTEAQQRLLALLPAAAAQAAPEEIRQLEQKAVVMRWNGEVVPMSSTFREFIARQPVAGLIQVPPVTLDAAQHLALLHGRRLSLSPTEYALLAHLCKHAGRLLTHDELGAELWGKEYRVSPEPERLKPVLRTLRRALGPDGAAIENVRGLGYRFARSRGL